MRVRMIATDKGIVGRKSRSVGVIHSNAGRLVESSICCCFEEMIELALLDVAILY